MTRLTFLSFCFVSGDCEAVRMPWSQRWQVKKVPLMLTSKTRCQSLGARSQMVSAWRRTLRSRDAKATQVSIGPNLASAVVKAASISLVMSPGMYMTLESDRSNGGDELGRSTTDTLAPAERKAFWAIVSELMDIIWKYQH